MTEDQKAVDEAWGAILKVIDHKLTPFAPDESARMRAAALSIGICLKCVVQICPDMTVTDLDDFIEKHSFREETVQ